MVETLAAIVLAGGASTRMGRDKGSIVVDPAGGVTLLERTVQAALSAGATTIVVAGDRPVPAAPRVQAVPTAQAVQTVPASSPTGSTGPGGSILISPLVRFVREDPPGSGPVAALDAALAGLEADRVLVLPCDLADPMAAARELVRAFDRTLTGTLDGAVDEALDGDLHAGGHDGVVAVDSTGRRQHLTALFRLPALRLQAARPTEDGDIPVTRVRERVAGLQLVEVPEPAGHPGLWDDMDTPEDLERHRSPPPAPATTPPGAPVPENSTEPRGGEVSPGTHPGTHRDIQQDIPGLADWLDAVAGELGLPASVVLPGPLLDVARDVAHGVLRPGAPTSTYLIGVAVGQQLAGRERTPEEISDVVDRLSARIQDLALGYDPAGGEG
ncbi:NTP transferase domain-containing protein [Citricoccus alkalitolerans]|uniref:NTP transferase domain-containing protein n=1 Tax=Citricoccus alkalitolerans TaxID=246603 RepID=A0ABV8Y052_9MICC